MCLWDCRIVLPRRRWVRPPSLHAEAAHRGGFLRLDRWYRPIARRHGQGSVKTQCRLMAHPVASRESTRLTPKRRLLPLTATPTDRTNVRRETASLRGRTFPREGGRYP